MRTGSTKQDIAGYRSNGFLSVPDFLTADVHRVRLGTPGDLARERGALVSTDPEAVAGPTLVHPRS